MFNVSGANIARQESSWWPCAQRLGLWGFDYQAKMMIGLMKRWRRAEANYIDVGKNLRTENA